MRSLIVQLLQQQTFDTTMLSKDINLEGVAGGDLEHLCRLFVWLVRRIPRDMTLVCIIDGLVYYERDDYEAGMLKAMKILLGLVRDRDLGLHIKVLATNPSPTDSVQGIFNDRDECFLSMAELPWIGEQFNLEASGIV